jgi:8-oxo-dGTP pyrophosphatase MutT (NUDIX family)
MPVEHSAGAIIYRKEGQSVLFLLLHYEEGHWGAPKGHIEKGETIEDTARREVQEETGLTDIQFRSGFKETIRYFFHGPEGRVFKTVTFLLGESGRKEIQISFEHTGYQWLAFPQALTETTYADEKKVVKLAAEFLSLTP